MSVTRISTISRNYAQALFDSFEDKETIKTQLGDVIDTINSSYDLKAVLINPSISYSKRLEIVDEIFNTKIDEKILNFIKLLIEKQRICELEEIFQAFNEILSYLIDIDRLIYF